MKVAAWDFQLEAQEQRAQIPLTCAASISTVENLGGLKLLAFMIINVVTDCLSSIRYQKWAHGSPFCTV